MKQNKIFLLMMFLCTSVFVFSSDISTVYLKNSYKDKGKEKDVYVTLHWQQKDKRRRETHVTMYAGRTSTQKAPIKDCYLRRISVVPSAAHFREFAGDVQVNDNTYFVITSGSIPKGAQNNKAEIHGYANQNAYNKIHAADAKKMNAKPVTPAKAMSNSASVSLAHSDAASLDSSVTHSASEAPAKKKGKKKNK